MTPSPQTDGRSSPTSAPGVGRDLTPAEQRDSFLHTANVCRAEAIARRQTHPAFAVTLDTWADNFVRRAAECLSGTQPDLFSEAA